MVVLVGIRFEILDDEKEVEDDEEPITVTVLAASNLKSNEFVLEFEEVMLQHDVGLLEVSEKSPQQNVASGQEIIGVHCVGDARKMVC